METWQPFNVLIEVPETEPTPEAFLEIDLLLFNIIEGKYHE